MGQTVPVNIDKKSSKMVLSVSVRDDYGNLNIILTVPKQQHQFDISTYPDLIFTPFEVNPFSYRSFRLSFIHKESKHFFIS